MKKYWFFGGVSFLALSVLVYYLGSIICGLYGSCSILGFMLWPSLAVADYWHRFFPVNLDLLLYIFSAAPYFFVGTLLGHVYGKIYNQKISSVISGS